jgi:formate hydrogenlyase transcriptional activator
MLNVPLAEFQPHVVPKSGHAATKLVPADHKGLQDVLDETERTEILRALGASNGVLAGPSGAAARLGMKRSTLQLRMQKLGIRLTRTALTDPEERRDNRPNQ